jgi:catechol 2,3-dioxygenase-like lactoylglutathione lyase family enzyme
MKRKRNKGPRRKRANKRTRLDLARQWIPTFSGKNIIKGYRNYFGVDFEAAIRELELLGVKHDPNYVAHLRNTIAGGLLARKRKKEERKRAQEELDLFDQDEVFAFIAGYTAGGAPYGTMWEEMRESTSDPDEEEDLEVFDGYPYYFFDADLLVEGADLRSGDWSTELSRSHTVMKVNFKRLDHIQICIPFGAEDQAREFYGNVLGLSEIPKPELLKKNGGMWFAIADIQLHVGVENIPGPSKRHPAFEVENVRAVRAYLESQGVKTRDEPTLEGVERFSFYDPFENRIELMERTDYEMDQ